jgi:lipopolysaccharide export system ATP-binding protein|tara:strand:+ start:232 stop:1008 length:777 start_codon:yes stop_codon:yes gene_type:complete
MGIIKKFRIKTFKKLKPLVGIKNVSLSFEKRQILNNVSFTINQGEILGMLGPNGVGKSTIFNLITGLIKPNYGSIFFNNIDATNYPIYMRTTKFKIGYVPQHGGYFHDLTLLENLKAIGEILIKEEKVRSNKIDSLVAKFELDAVRNIKAKFLSGGQKKKLVIALALLGDPKVLLLDECFAALDVLTIKMLQQIIVNLQTENNIGICICDHQARDLLNCVDKAIILSNCKIIAQGTPSELITNNEAKSAYFGDSFQYN